MLKIQNIISAGSSEAKMELNVREGNKLLIDWTTTISVTAVEADCIETMTCCLKQFSSDPDKNHAKDCSIASRRCYTLLTYHIR
jgi:hypothetical protein